jgi:hypothetical protein
MEGISVTVSTGSIEGFMSQVLSHAVRDPLIPNQEPYSHSRSRLLCPSREGGCEWQEMELEAGRMLNWKKGEQFRLGVVAWQLLHSSASVKAVIGMIIKAASLCN